MSPQSMHHSHALPAHGIDKGEAPLPHLLVGEHVHTCTSREIQSALLLPASMRLHHSSVALAAELHLRVSGFVQSDRTSYSQTDRRGAP